MDEQTILQYGEINVKGEFLWGSNYTFLVDIEHADGKALAVYKPSRGERPLWDFPAASLAHREVAAYLVSQALGWNFVPPTAFRDQAPLGPGSLQLFIEHDPEYHFFNFNERDIQRLRPVVAFDYLINNADRKGSHILKDEAGRIWLIDHGLCFHEEDKLRTVIWNFIGEEIPGSICEDVTKLHSGLLAPAADAPSHSVKLLAHLSPQEVHALAARAERLVVNGRFPAPDPERRPFPWPQL
jgi:uncharacterized repeat protein (TIGR03843 family)